MFVVVTKIDLATPQIFNKTITELSQILRDQFKLKHVVVKDENELDQIIQLMPPMGTMCPIFKVSNVGETAGIDLLKKFLLKLSLNGSQEIQIDEKNANQNTSIYNELVESEFIIDSTYKKNDLIVSGTVTKGKIQVN